MTHRLACSVVRAEPEPSIMHTFPVRPSRLTGRQEVESTRRVRSGGGRRRRYEGGWHAVNRWRIKHPGYGTASACGADRRGHGLHRDPPRRRRKRIRPCREYCTAGPTPATRALNCRDRDAGVGTAARRGPPAVWASPVPAPPEREPALDELRWEGHRGTYTARDDLRRDRSDRRRPTVAKVDVTPSGERSCV